MQAASASNKTLTEGRIMAEIVCAMTSKYAIALYELVQLRANLDKCIEVFSVDRLRELLGVPEANYERVDNLMRKVIELAMLQVNGLSDLNVAIEARRRHSRAPVHEFALTWWSRATSFGGGAQAWRDCAARSKRRQRSTH